MSCQGSKSLSNESHKDVLVFSTVRGVWIDLLICGSRTSRFHFNNKEEAIEILERALKQIKEL